MDETTYSAEVHEFKHKLVSEFWAGQRTLAEITGFQDGSLQAAYKLACQYINKGKLPNAERILRALVILDPYVADFWQALAIVLHRKLKFGAAEMNYGIALRLDPDDAISFTYRGECRLQMGEIDKGVADLERAIELGQSRPNRKAYVQRARIILKRVRGMN